MNEMLSNLDMELKELFTAEKYDELNELLKSNEDETVKALSDYNRNIIKKYYEAENYELLFRHFRFVAFSCYIVEYSYNRGLISDDAFGIMMSVYNDIYELKKKERLDS